jgi:RNA recognition motif-containing protein
MGKKLYIGNLPFTATDGALLSIFSQIGKVESAKIIIDRRSGRSKGYGFVEMSSDQEAAESVEKFHGAEFEGRSIQVSEARPSEPKEEGEGGGRGRGRFDRNDRNSRGRGPRDGQRDHNRDHNRGQQASQNASGSDSGADSGTPAEPAESVAAPAPMAEEQ